MKTILKAVALATLITTSLATTAAVTQGKKYGAFEGVCEGGSCGVAQAGKNSQGTTGAMHILKPAADGQQVTPLVIIGVPLGVTLYGMEISIDNTKLGVIPYDHCEPNACVAVFPLEADVLNKLKSGNKLSATFIVGPDKQTLEFSLKGFTAALNAL